jgi:hypothetical protein
MQLIIVYLQMSHASGYDTEASTATGLYPREHSVLENTEGNRHTQRK